ncbi:UPF0561 protein C2orf68 homolog [Styela clava]
MDKNSPGLDMKHGFIHHIRRNQMKRDEYDRKIKSDSYKPKMDKSDSQKYPDKKVYRPKPARSNHRDQAETLDVPHKINGTGKLLYYLEYTDNGGWVHKVSVHRDDNPKELAKRLAVAAKIPNDLLETLEWKIQQDIAKRDTNQ